MKKHQRIINVVSAWIFIFIIAFLICLPFVKPGYIDGHDNIFHFSHISDLYIAVKSGKGFSPISPTLYQGIGYGTRLFYSSFAHTFVVCIGLLIEPLGFSLLGAYKTFIFLSIFLSGILTYYFVRRMTGNNIYAICSAVIYMAFPYRIVDIYIRNAASEIFAFVFLPGVFWGIYEILNQHKRAIKGYLIVVINFSLLIITHNLTAIYCAIFGLIFILFNISKLIKLIKKDKMNLGFVFLSIVAILLITSPYWTSLSAQSGIKYVVFNKNAMGSNLERIKSSIDNASIFLFYGTNFYEYNLLKLSLACALGVIIYFLIKGNLKSKYKNSIATGVASIVLIVSPLILNWGKPNYFNDDYQPEFLLMFIFVVLALFDQQKEEEYRKGHLSYFIGFVGLLFGLHYLIYNLAPWKAMPSLLYNIQFSWRLWTFFGLFFAIIFPLLFNYIKIPFAYKKVILTGVSLYCTVSIYPINKGALMSNVPSNLNDYPYNIYAGGWSREYFPEGFFGYYDGRSELSDEIRKFLNFEYYQAGSDHFIYDEDRADFQPYSTNNQDAIFENVYNSAPWFRMDVTISRYTTIQIPFLYYNGYQVSVTTGEETFKVTPYNLDYLVTFNIPASELTTFHIEVDYVGTTAMRVANVISPLTIGVIFVSSVTYFVYFKKEEKKCKS